jgi:type IV secretion system protein VirD4
MTAVAEDVLDTALLLASRSGWGRLCPPMLACLDELPSTAPLPTLRTRMANERALGVSFIYAAQTWRQLAAVFGEQEARAFFGLANVLVMFGGSKDGAFNQEISDLVGQTRFSRTNWQTGAMAGRTFSGKATGKQLDLPVVHVWDVRDGKIARFRQFADTAKFPEVVAAELATTTCRGGGQRMSGAAN